MDELENECGNSSSKPGSQSTKKNTKETNNLIDKLTEILRLINKAKVEADDDVDQSMLQFEVTHELTSTAPTETLFYNTPLARGSKPFKPASLSKKTYYKEKVG
jgi:hypothetical protein